MQPKHGAVVGPKEISKTQFKPQENNPTQFPHGLELDDEIRALLGNQSSLVDPLQDPSVATEFSSMIPKPGRNPYTPEGFQERKVRRPIKGERPSWARDITRMRHHILALPVRRYRIAYLFWGCGWNAREVAEELGISQGLVENTLHRMRLEP